MFRKSSIATKLSALLALPVITLVLVITFILISGKSSTDGLIDTIYQDAYISSTQLIHADRDLYQANNSLNSMILSEDDTEFQAALEDFNGNMKEIKDRIKSTKENYESNEIYGTLKNPETGLTLEDNFDNFETFFSQWENETTDLIDQIQATPIAGRSQLEQQSKANMSIFLEARNSLDQLGDISDVYAEDEVVKFEEEYKKMFLFSIGIAVIIIVLIIAIGTLFIIRTIKRIKQLVTVTTKISEGDLTTSALEIGARDELGQLTESVNIMNENLNNLVRSLDDSVIQVVESSVSMSAISEEVAASVADIVNTLDDIAMGASQGAQDAEVTNERTRELSEQIEKVKQNATEMLQQSQEADQASNSGIMQINTLKDSSVKTNEVLGQVSQVITTLTTKIQDIEKIIDVINDISNQTNLLALNASIEAARAGEHGKGFAVVAEEVRKLAEQSSQATHEIRTTIQLIVSESNNATAAVETTEAITTEQQTVVKDTEQVFETINNSIRNIAQSIQHINNGVLSMNQLQSEVLKSVDSISAFTEESAASTQQISASTEEQLKGIDEVAQSAEKLSELSENLKVTVSKFNYSK
ncbi:methyl-accepting chemotaxis protein [Ureibacillus aquaedulcis]|uniref:HAMP domain-containing methyl-accepting chemotaxis protein n=1 Tax=Ureibacillus aquaedulcis TaxID=3058421 RepID=A0ABT8GP97_9BACL|nr:HAMP domain-containing methyl-accepting chemotaxis protein [Ureibacillus sp. BA0131]MDN4493232.1 HAMP domain-containing methyl-accepting chemotaxis protein [Ureibacillus sp. BA0131]